jgi:hypothetical protein
MVQGLNATAAQAASTIKNPSAPWTLPMGLPPPATNTPEDEDPCQIYRQDHHRTHMERIGLETLDAAEAPLQ